MPESTPVTAMNVGPLSGTLTVLLTIFSALTRRIKNMRLIFQTWKIEASQSDAYVYQVYKV